MLRRVSSSLLPPACVPFVRQYTDMVRITPSPNQERCRSLDGRVHMFADEIVLRTRGLTPWGLAQWVDRQFWKVRAPMVTWGDMWSSPEEGCKELRDLYRIWQGKTPMAEAILGRNLLAVRKLLDKGWNATLEQDIIAWEALGREGRERAMGLVDALCRGHDLIHPDGFDETVIRELIASGVSLSGLLCAVMDSSRLHTQMALFLCHLGVMPERFKQETGGEMDGWLIDLRGKHRDNPAVIRFVEALSPLLPPG